MNNKHIDYSCSSWLSYHICERYYGNKHYAWCMPCERYPARPREFCDAFEL